MCHEVPPAPLYKGGEEEAGHQRARHGGSPTRTPSPSRIPLSFSGVGKGEKEEGVGEGKGGAAPSLVQFGPAHGVRPPLVALFSFPLRPMKAQYFP